MVLAKMCTLKSDEELNCFLLNNTKAELEKKKILVEIDSRYGKLLSVIVEKFTELQVSKRRNFLESQIDVTKYISTKDEAEMSTVQIYINEGKTVFFIIFLKSSCH